MLSEEDLARRTFLGLVVGASVAGIAPNSLAAPKEVSRAPWLSLPPTPQLPAASRQGHARINGVSIFFAQFGKGKPVLLLHGGLANSNYWANQVTWLSQNYAVTVMDTRGQGRSPFTAGKFGYDTFAKDVIGLMDFLDIPSASIVGWSDGGITGIELALTRPDRLSALFAFGANVHPDGLKAGGARVGAFASFASRCRKEYLTLSPSPERWPELQRALGVMWRTQPDFSKARLASIKLPITIAVGQYDEIIKLEHTRQIAADIVGARLSVMRDVSHFAMLQKPEQFNSELQKFLVG